MPRATHGEPPPGPPKPEREGGGDPDTIYAVGVVSGRTGGPLVDLRWGDQHAMLDPHEMANHVQLLMREAWWADSDAALLSFLMTKLNLDPGRAAAVMNDFREHRLNQLDAAARVAADRHRAAYTKAARAEQKRRDERGGN